MKKPEIIAGKYEVLELIGRGGMGTVFKAYHRNLDRTVAIKMLAEELASDPEFRARFQQEALLIAKLNHPNIVGIYDVESHEDTFCIIMEYLDGESLQTRVDREHHVDQALAVAVGAQVARALHHAHLHGVVHRDVKPDNIFLTTGGIVKVMDFGIARFADSKLKTQTGISMGTPKYMSPEQVTGKNVDSQSDLYSLGVCLYTALTGRVPFDGENPVEIATKHLYEQPQAIRTLNPEVDERVEAAVLRALEKSKTLRYATGEEMANGLEASIQGKAPIRVGHVDSVPSGATRRMPTAGLEFTPSSVAVATPPPPTVTPRELSEEVSLFEPPPRATPPENESVIHETASRRGPIVAIASVAIVIAGLLGFHFLQPHEPEKGKGTELPPAKRLEQTRANASKLRESGDVAGARQLWVSFSTECPQLVDAEVTKTIDLLTAQLPATPQFAYLLAERREALGNKYLNEKPSEPALALAYLEGARALKPDGSKLNLQNINLLQRNLERQREGFTPEDRQRTEQLRSEATSTSSTAPAKATAALTQAIREAPWDFDLWIDLARIFKSEGYVDDARVLLAHVDRNTSVSDPVKRQAAALLTEPTR